MQFRSKEEAEAWLVGQTLQYPDWKMTYLIPAFTEEKFRRLEPPCNLGCTHDEAVDWPRGT